MSPDSIQPSTILFSLARASSQYPFITAQPLRINSPGTPTGHALPLLSTIFAYKPSKIVPTEVVLLINESDGLVW